MEFRDSRTVEASIRNILMWALAYSAYALLWRWLFARFPPRLKAEAKKMNVQPEAFPYEASQCVVAITSHFILGPSALYLAIIYHYFGSTQQGLSAFFPGAQEPYWMNMDLLCAYLGEVAIGNFTYQLIFWFLRWETGLDAFVHHLGFISSGMLICFLAVYPKLSSSAMAMEVSSPFLNLHLLFRQLDGRMCAVVSEVSSVLFAALFVFVRIIFFGNAVLNFHYLYFFHHDLFPPWASPMLTKCVLVTFMVGWLLQLFWGRMVLAKSLRTLRGCLGKKKPK